MVPGSLVFRFGVLSRKYHLPFVFVRLDEEVREHIQTYFEEALGYMGDTDENVIELAMLFVQCLEVY